MKLMLKKLESFRKQNKNYLFPSFSTISATGKNGSIIHYHASNKTCREIKPNDIPLTLEDNTNMEPLMLQELFLSKTAQKY